MDGFKWPRDEWPTAVYTPDLWQPISRLLIMVAGLYGAGVRAKGPRLGSVWNGRQ